MLKVFRMTIDWEELEDKKIRDMEKLYIEYSKILTKTYIDPLSIIITSKFFSLTKDTTYFLITYFIIGLIIHAPAIYLKK